MLHFENDYSEGAHPNVLRRLIDTNSAQLTGYGEDECSVEAKRKIAQACGKPDADVFLLVGGTQSNQVVISSLLTSYEGVVAADTGHVSMHEAGAIETAGHKVLTIPGVNGKIEADALERFLAAFFEDPNHEHMVFPGMVYISYPTEYGTLYSKDELTRISSVCHRYDLPLYADGARLGYALACPQSDLTLTDIANLCDVFYIGGTKVGALCGEAVVFPGGNAPAHMLTMIKQHGALLAKGRLVGAQFDALFTDDLYMRISRNAIETAASLREALIERGYRFYIDSPTNQIFIILEDSALARLAKDVIFSIWERFDDEHTVIRLATSWATKQSDVDALIALL
ncbi:MAG: aminotransferase class I/II-fold pyridoxal phosphate-dependent enzyme [Bifidobacterium psychraerophilum]|uniref:threonine aldolase family protein n=1 Tax=Bifidobacterium psychraerophilum TaxID=218140 RepID=UPI0039EA674B